MIEINDERLVIAIIVCLNNWGIVYLNSDARLLIRMSLYYRVFATVMSSLGLKTPKNS